MDLSPLKRLLGTPEGDALKAFIAAHIKATDSLEGITATDPHQVAVQVEARKVARTTLEEMFTELGTLSEKEPGPVDKSEFGM